MKEFWLKILRKLKDVKPWQRALIYLSTTVFCAAAILFAVFSGANLGLQIVSYVCYAFAALSLAYSLYLIVRAAPTVKARLIERIKRVGFGKRLLEQYGFRTVVFAAVSLAINVAYVSFNAVLAIYFKAVWYGALAGYYALLTALRSGIVLYHRRKSKSDVLEEADIRKTELKKYRACGIMLTVIPFFLSFAILQMVTEGRAFVHMGWTSIAFAAYAFYKITMAIYNVIKARKQEDITVLALRNVGLADAFVSILALQTCLLYAYSEGAQYGYANALTGGAVCAATLVLGVIMIAQANKKTKELKRTTEDGRKEE